MDGGAGADALLTLMTDATGKPPIVDLATAVEGERR